MKIRFTIIALALTLIYSASGQNIVITDDALGTNDLSLAGADADRLRPRPDHRQQRPPPY